jgi:hypothetical protein
MVAEYIGTGIVKDNRGTEYKIYPYSFLGKVVTATINVVEFPIGCVAKVLNDKTLLGWVDNDFPFKDVLDELITFYNSDGDLKELQVKDNDNDVFTVELRKENAQYMAIVREGTVIPIASAMLTTTGMLKNWWVNKEFRGSPTLREHEAILLRNTLKNGWLPQKLLSLKLDGMFTKVHNENVIANKARAKFGFKVYGRLKEKGVDYFYSGQKIDKCLDRVNELIKVGS